MAWRLVPGDREATTLAPLSYDWAAITPAWAQRHLDSALSSSPERHGEVAAMIDDMRAGRWLLTGETIVLSDQGRLLDGGKRLLACVRADTPFPTLLIRGVPESALDSENNVRARRLSDILGIRLEPNHVSMATMLYILWHCQHGRYDRTCSMGSDAQLLMMLEANPEIRTSLAVANHRGRHIRLPIFAAFHFLIHQIDPALSNEFCKAILADGAAINAKKPEGRHAIGHPARALNDLVLHDRSTDKAMAGHEAALAAMVLAWNAYRDGVAPKSLRWAPETDAGQPVEFPAISGWGARSLALVPPAPAAGEAAPAPVVVTSSPAPASLEDINDLDYHPLAAAVYAVAFGEGEPDVRLEMIDADGARRLLADNRSNRGLFAATIDRYRRDMTAGKFVSTNGQTVKIGRSGRLLDSQHRLSAVAAANARLPFVIVRGLPDEAFGAMDRGNTKTYAHILRHRKVPNAASVAAAVRWQYYFLRSQFRAMSGMIPSNPELDAVLAAHPELAQSMRYNHKLRDYIPPGCLCWLEYQLFAADVDAATVFFDGLSSLEGLAKGDPALILRRRIEAESKGKVPSRGAKGAAGEPDAIKLMALFVLAWNAHVNAEKISPGHLVWRGPFPEISKPSNRLL